MFNGKLAFLCKVVPEAKGLRGKKCDYADLESNGALIPGAWALGVGKAH